MEINGINRPIFVVGASRSGTELMRSILNQHPSVRISTETHYFDDLRVKLKGHEQRGLTEQEAYRCEVYFRTAMHRRYGHRSEPANLSLSQQALRGTAAMIGTGADAFFEAFCRLDAQQNGADRWGEKTPRHIFCLPEIMRAYPGAQIICMVRDPRAVIASYRDWKQFRGTDMKRNRSARSHYKKKSGAFGVLIISSLHVYYGLEASGRRWKEKSDLLASAFSFSATKI